MSLDVPKVTVVTPVYNGEKHLRDAIESILNQTFRDFEFIIIDGGSTDVTPAILAHYQQNDERLRVYIQKNEGVTDSRNRGCHLARGKYIAMMDADDVSLPQRLARQVEYLDAHPDIGVLGTWTQWIDENSKPLANWQSPTAPGVIGWHLILWDCLAQSSVMMRRDIVQQVGFYDAEALHSEDYDLWARASLVTLVANLPETLVRYRLWQSSRYSQHSQTAEQYADRVSHAMVTKLLGSEVSLETVTNLRHSIRRLPLASIQQVESSASLVKRLYRAYLHANALSSMEAREVAQAAGIRLLALALEAGKSSLWKSFVIAVQGLRISPNLLVSKHVITEGMGRGVKVVMRRG